MKKFYLFLSIFVLIITPAFSQEFNLTGDSTKNLEPAELQSVSPISVNTERLLLSMSSEDYPVTPGDVYNLTYLRSNRLVSQQIIVESDYTVKLSIFGEINAKNLTFPAFKKLLEKKISEAYPDSMPSVTILSNGLFQVYIKGEVTQSNYVTCWGLSRLSQIIKDYLTPYSSMRNVKIIHVNGTSNQFDLFKAKRFGIKEEDPYLKPGDIIIVFKRDREIQIKGQVKRPGEYQLLPGEGLKELIEYYGDGFTELADKSRIRIDRFITDKDEDIAETLYLDVTKEYSNKIALRDLDIVYVPPKIERLPVVYFEGAIGESDNFQNKIPYRFKKGETLYTALQSMKKLISPMADLTNAFLTRESESQIINVNLQKLLYNYDPADDIELMPYDRIVIPFGKFEIFIKGEVKSSKWLVVESLTRLSEVVSEYLTDYSSIRDIEIVSSNGESNKYDLFRAQRFGEKEQDPYLKPGDTIIVSKRDREVKITGEVRRPGRYQLLPGEGLRELIEYYGDGFTELADKTRIELDRYVTGSDKIAERFIIDLRMGYDKEFDLKDLDSIHIPKKTKRLPVIYIEGAIKPPEIDTKESVTIEERKVQSSNKITVMYKEGTTLYDVLWARKNLLFPMADLSNSYIRREGLKDVVPVNLEKLLYEYDKKYDLILKPYDHIIIPFKQFFVIVLGGVKNPGTYPYVPNKTYEYYISLAGGVDPERGSTCRVRIYDRNNKRRSNKSIIDPEDRIVVPYSLSYYGLKYFTIITSSISTLITILIAGGVI